MRFFLILCFVIGFSAYADFPKTIKKVKPSIVGIGVYTPDGRPQNVLNGTGFIIGNGQYIVTNQHVVPKLQNIEGTQKRVVFTGTGKQAKIYEVELIAVSNVHDLAILKHNGPPLPALKLAGDSLIDEGTSIAFTGFPIGAVLGLYPATHQGYIASISPVVIPSSTSAQLTPAAIKLLKNPYMVYQLDGTAYPGNSGSPVYPIKTGKVVAIINKVFIKRTKESAITDPSGITYAIPVKFLHQLIKTNNIDIYAQ
ncbi:serine protease [Thalassotalea aquiviva]|uniref:S1 family peptidase n=1 Tax=Thalassotalea aquiviva TaxID=3242415 RepID=UPI00352B08E5